MHQWRLFYFLGYSNSAERKPEDTHKSIQMLLLMQVAFVGTLCSGKILALLKSTAKLPPTSKAPTDVNGWREAMTPSISVGSAASTPQTWGTQADLMLFFFLSFWPLLIHLQATKKECYQCLAALQMLIFYFYFLQVLNCKAVRTRSRIKVFGHLTAVRNAGRNRLKLINSKASDNVCLLTWCHLHVSWLPKRVQLAQIQSQNELPHKDVFVVPSPGRF